VNKEFLHEKKPRISGFFYALSGLHRMSMITWQQMRQQQEPMRQQLVQQLERMRQQLVQQLELVRVLEQQLLFCRKRTKQQQQR
jgi:sensor domain CHASE-containing protein